eukprot:GHVH01006642.1.p1 GENE.GHVH01006642.1~~GHVH01006642.1.p1  ORF type:complete len:473 (+),score=45.72 GHVH01006642.1:577-1995(+)
MSYILPPAVPPPADSHIQKQCFRTKMCSFFKEGKCNKGDQCSFAHNMNQLKDRPDFKKTRLCVAFNQNKCMKPYDECPFAHGEEDLKRFARHNTMSRTAYPNSGDPFLERPQLQHNTTNTKHSRSPPRRNGAHANTNNRARNRAVGTPTISNAPDTLPPLMPLGIGSIDLSKITMNGLDSPRLSSTRGRFHSANYVPRSFDDEASFNSDMVRGNDPDVPNAIDPRAPDRFTAQSFHSVHGSRAPALSQGSPGLIGSSGTSPITPEPALGMGSGNVNAPQNSLTYMNYRQPGLSTDLSGYYGQEDTGANIHQQQGSLIHQVSNLGRYYPALHHPDLQTFDHSGAPNLNGSSHQSSHLNDVFMSPNLDSSYSIYASPSFPQESSHYAYSQATHLSLGPNHQYPPLAPNRSRVNSATPSLLFLQNDDALMSGLVGTGSNNVGRHLSRGSADVTNVSVVNSGSTYGSSEDAYRHIK